MDISRQTNGDEGTSMYLSFDSEGTSMSSAAFKTLEALGDISDMAFEDEVIDEESRESHMNSTLEAQDLQDSQAHLKTVKKMEVVSGSPLRVYPKNILQEYKAVSSTPSKEQLLRSVEITRGSEPCHDLGLAFMDMENEKPLTYNEENKENALPCESTEEGSTLSCSSSVEIVTSVIYQKMSTLSTTEEESLEEVQEEKKEVEAADADVTPKAIVVTEAAEIEEKRKVEFEASTSAATQKQRRSIVAPKTYRKSICEPDLQANRPSRIVDNAKKRPSLAASSKCASNNDKVQDIASDIPKLLNKMLKIANGTKGDETDSAKIKKPADNNDKRKTLTNNVKSRPSFLPTTAQGEKRPFHFSQRMSVLVRTTLNSPARKIQRRSIMPPAGMQARRSVMPAARSQAANLRKSMLPVQSDKAGTATTTTTTTKMGTMTTTTMESKLSANGNPAGKDNASKLKQAMRKSVYTATLKATNSAPPQLEVSSRNKTEPSFVCHVCNSKFRIKSLLDAHKRSHEDGTPAFVKKPTTAAAATNSMVGSSSSSNQCKYCDKKFALLRALHIHLLQNCAKIPPKEKRKLEFTEMNHVEKAQLPAVFSHAHNSVSTHSSSNASDKLSQKSYSNLSSAAVSSTESLIEKKEVTIIGSGKEEQQMAPPSVNKVKKKTAHAGVYRTPNKNVICHICKKSFKTIIDHINHKMSEHYAINLNEDNITECVETLTNVSTE